MRSTAPRYLLAFSPILTRFSATIFSAATCKLYPQSKLYFLATQVKTTNRGCILSCRYKTTDGLFPYLFRMGLGGYNIHMMRPWSTMACHLFLALAALKSNDNLIGRNNTLPLYIHRTPTCQAWNVLRTFAPTFTEMAAEIAKFYESHIYYTHL